MKKVSKYFAVSKKIPICAPVILKDQHFLFIK